MIAAQGPRISLADVAARVGSKKVGMAYRAHPKQPSSGFKTKEYDILHGPKGDLTSPSVLRQVRQDIKAGTVAASMLAPLCTTFPVAKDRTKVIRTRIQPWGMDAHLLIDKELLI